MEVCVLGSVGTGDLNDIAGESFEVDLSLSDGTTQGQGSRNVQLGIKFEVLVVLYYNAWVVQKCW